MPTDPTAVALKAELKRLGETLPEVSRVRLHRAISWLKRAEQEAGDHDARFIFLWIAFNAAYAQEFGFEQPERELLRAFLAKLVKADSANTLHIMGWPEVEALFAGLPAVLADDARLVISGPFNYGGEFTSASNAQFNVTLKGWGAHMAIRDFEAVDALARGAGLRLLEDRAMPANNRCLVWAR